MPKLDDENFRKKITQILFEKSKYEYNFKLINDISKKKFNEGDFVNLSKVNSTTVEQIQLNSVEDTNKFDINSVKLSFFL